MMNQETQYLLALLSINGLRPSRLRHCLLRYGSAERLYRLEFDPIDQDERELVDLIRATQGDPQRLDKARSMLAALERLGGRAVTILEHDYPLSLNQWASSPLIIYVRGEFSRINDYAVSVVGTREASPEGIQQAQTLARELAAREVTVLSGLAKGIDSAAHRGAIEVSGGRTAAVVGTGLDTVYPAENRALQDAIIAASGAIISQFPPNSITHRSNFPQRNMLMSALSQGTVVIEAGSTSGAKLQAEYALKQRRLVFMTALQVEKHPWAQSLAAQHPDRVVVVKQVGDVLEHMVSLDQVGQASAFRNERQLPLLSDA